jgi:hypothetical protein
MSTLSIVSDGAKPDGKTVNTRAIQTSIDRCHAAGGGIVEFPPGDWVSGTLRLRSRVHLNLLPGASLLGSTDGADYPVQPTPAYRSQKDPAGFRALIYAEGETTIGLFGAGTIDGRGAAFPFGGDDADGRPRLIQFVSCSDIRVVDLRLRDSGLWMQHYLNCDHVSLRGLRVWNHANRNNDMVDIDGCRNVTISDCVGDTDDDGITLKSTGPAPCENIVIANCILSSRCNAIKLGTESTGGFRNIAISNCIVKPSAAPDGIYGHPEGISAVALEIVDGGTLDGVIISNLRVTGTRSPFFIRLANRARPFLPHLPKPNVGRLRNIMIQNVLVSEAGDVGSSMTGLPSHPIENITFENVRIENRVAGVPQHAAVEFPEKPEAYPEATMWGPLPAHGFYVRHTRNVRFDNVFVAAANGEVRPVFVSEDVYGIQGQPQG